MRRGQKNNSFLQNDKFAQYGIKDEIINIDIYASRKMRRFAKRKGLIADTEIASVDYVKNTNKK